MFELSDMGSYSRLEMFLLQEGDILILGAIMGSMAEGLGTQDMVDQWIHLHYPQKKIVSR